MDRIKAECLEHGPKGTMQSLSIEVGGVAGASAPGELPQNERQVINTRRQEKGKRQVCGPSGEVNELFVVMRRAYSEDH